MKNQQVTTSAQPLHLSSPDARQILAKLKTRAKFPIDGVSETGLDDLKKL